MPVANIWTSGRSGSGTWSRGDVRTTFQSFAETSSKLCYRQRQSLSVEMLRESEGIVEDSRLSPNPEVRPSSDQVESVGGMPYRTLGRTGERVSLVGLGGWHIGKPADEREGIEIIRTALDNEVNFLDNCWDYHKGNSEVRMGKALRDGYRQRAFLMTKIDGRTREAAARQIDDSLRRLQTDHIDLMQFHEIIRMEDPDLIFAAGGAMEAMLAAKRAGKIRYIGFTGHKDP